MTSIDRGQGLAYKRAMPATPPKIGFVSLGCPKALVDSERIITKLRAEEAVGLDRSVDAERFRPRE